MLFSSMTFLFYFLPLFFMCYFIVPSRYRNSVLLLFSLFFYAWGEPVYVFLMIGAICFGYYGAILMEKYPMQKKNILIVLISIAVIVFGYFKYLTLIIECVEMIIGKVPFSFSIILPIGISFFTFQIIGYLIDVYRGVIKANHHFLDFACFVSMFPQLIAGPIVRYQDVEGDLNNRITTSDNIYYGVRRFIVGLSKKVLISNALGQLVREASSVVEGSMLSYWCIAIGFMLQIYFDFSGYSDMAIGLGKIMGFNFPENFDYPFVSRSVSEFWRRWHITLGGWFREYVYIPLGGNRVSSSRFILNIVIVWSLTGLWHGAAYNFIFWGLYFAVILLIEKKYLSTLLNKYKIWSHVYVVFIVLISFVVFNVASLSEFFEMMKGMFIPGYLVISNVESVYLALSYCQIVVIAMVGSGPFVKDVYHKYNEHLLFEIIEVIGLIILSVLVISCLVDGSYNPFLYFRF